MTLSITEILTLDRTEVGAHVHSKKRLFEHVSELIAQDVSHLNNEDIFHVLLARERLGSTAVGHGIAIPHGRLKNAEMPMGALIKLATPLPFDAIDGEPVDIFFVLLVPEDTDEAHLEWLSLLAESFSNVALRTTLREISTKETLFQTLVDAVDAIIVKRRGEAC